MHLTFLFLSALFLGNCKGVSISKEAGIQLLDGVTPSPRHCADQESGQFVEFEMTGCTTEPCEMLEGQSYTVSTTFIPGIATNGITYHLVYQYAIGNVIPFPEFTLPTRMDPGVQYKLTRDITVGQVSRNTTGLLWVHL
ncbi:NPC intracellular cholesterol transporter 2 isoform X2 [Folsomia candida]|uniref:Epididymal secretory protein E1 n=1 Tax=Folsomia candida TaxID=158441 RepID=A0A226EZH8_FOLCA|nr:NPC intracellular cholesterol transporter 2 isoform X2 [Folsomia candida]OXA62973.1 Epididymal secretory protein E1 [Folsomia candida]